MSDLRIRIDAFISNVFARLDLISWLDLFAAVQKHGRLVKLAWLDTSGYEVEGILRRYSIHAYGRALRIDLEKDSTGHLRKVYRRWIYVNEKQASWSEYVLLCGGIGLITVIDPANSRRAASAGGLPAPWAGGRRARASTPVEATFDVFGALLGASDGGGRRVARREGRRAAQSARRGTK